MPSTGYKTELAKACEHMDAAIAKMKEENIRRRELRKSAAGDPAKSVAVRQLVHRCIHAKALAILPSVVRPVDDVVKLLLAELGDRLEKSHELDSVTFDEVLDRAADAVVEKVRRARGDAA